MKKRLQLIAASLFMASLLLTACADELLPDPAPLDTETILSDPQQIEDQRSNGGEHEDSIRWD